MNEDIYTMQQDALRRVNEMRARARANLAPEPTASQRSANDGDLHKNRKKEYNEKQAPEHEPKEHNKEGFAKGLKNFPLLSFIKDNEQLLILLLIVVLAGEDCDEGLLLALLYICL